MYYDLIIKGTYNAVSDETLRKISDIPGVRSAEAVYAADSESDTDGRDWLDVTEKTLKTYCDRRAEELSKINDWAVKSAIQKDQYAMYLIGIGEKEFERVCKACGLETDPEEFLLGKIGIWLNDKETGGQTAMPQTAQTVHLGSPDGKKIVIPKMERMPADSSTLRYVSEIAPDIIISSETLCAMTKTFVSQVNILLEHPQQSSQIQETILNILDDPEITIDSKQEKTEKADSSFFVIRILGTAMSLILFVIGIMNFINTVYAGILAREKELAMLECIGMSKKQMKQMLVAEGIFYMLVTAGLVLTLGTVIYLKAYQAFTKIAEWAQLRYPFRAAAVTGVLLAVMAVTVPLISYHSISKESAIEQLRKSG